MKKVSPKEQQRRSKISKSLKKRFAKTGGNVKLSETLKEEYSSGKKKAWNLGLTKETSVSVKSQSKKVSESMKAQYKLGVRSPVQVIPWNKGLTKEVDGRVLKSSIRMMENNPMKYCVTPEYRERMSKVMTGRKVSEEQRVNYSLAAAKRIMDGKSFQKHKGYCGKMTLSRLKVEVHYRSTWEKLVLELADKDEKVLAVSVESIRIPYVSSQGRLKNYVPDILVTFIDKRYLLEVKPLGRIGEEEIKKIYMGVNYAVNNGLTYLLVTEEELFASVTTTFSEVIQRATANDLASKLSRRYSLNSVVTQRGKEKSLTRQIGVKV